jgi:hypothetical protein
MKQSIELKEGVYPGSSEPRRRRRLLVSGSAQVDRRVGIDGSLRLCTFSGTVMAQKGPQLKSAVRQTRE